MANVETSQDSESALPSTTTPPTGPASAEAIYSRLSQYPFDTDREYQNGLATILGHPGAPATPEELVEKSHLALQAQCFYFSRRFNAGPIDPAAYSSWLQAQSGSSSQVYAEATTAPAAAETETGTQSTATSAPEPPYPTSFAAIVDLITRNIPVPGIEEIPTTVLEHGSSKVDKTPRRKKPWEKDEDEQDAVEAQSTATTQTESEVKNDNVDPAETSVEEMIDVNGHKETGQGVVKILQPNAIPDSGLLSKD